jgi:hypothetical protein
MLRGLINTDFGFSPLAGLMAILFFPSTDVFYPQKTVKIE